jgi:hypothetical protein
LQDQFKQASGSVSRALGHLTASLMHPENEKTPAAAPHWRVTQQGLN